MPSCCIAYTTDSTYLFPTFVSATQARRFSSPEKADVVIYCFDLNNAAAAAFGPACARENIQLVPIDSTFLGGASIMLARLFLDCYAAPEYKHFLYIDGDTQIRASLDPLIDAEVPEGSFMAANDPMTFLLADGGLLSQNLNGHLASIGLNREQASSYFNSGVLRINRVGWNQVGKASWQHFQTNGKPRFPDQDSLNVVSYGRRIPMSLKWNFPIFMRNCRVEDVIEPAILHFMSNPKPWHGEFAPWNRTAVNPYTEALAANPALQPYRLTMARSQRILYHLQQRRKQVMETIRWGYSQRRQRVLQYQLACAV